MIYHLTLLLFAGAWKLREDPDFMAVPIILQEKLAEYNARPALREGTEEPQRCHFEMV